MPLEKQTNITLDDVDQIRRLAVQPAIERIDESIKAGIDKLTGKIENLSEKMEQHDVAADAKIQKLEIRVSQHDLDLAEHKAFRVKVLIVWGALVAALTVGVQGAVTWIRGKLLGP